MLHIMVIFGLRYRYLFYLFIYFSTLDEQHRIIVSDFVSSLSCFRSTWESLLLKLSGNLGTFMRNLHGLKLYSTVVDEKILINNHPTFVTNLLFEIPIRSCVFMGQ